MLKFKEGLSSHLSAEKLGKLLQESHESSSRNFENSCKELDFLADNLNSHTRVLGARLTGGGFGGAVMAWTHSTFDELDAKGITDKYRDKFDRDIDFHHFLPSDGARKEDLLKK